MPLSFRLIELARRGERLPPWWLALLLALFAPFLAQFVGLVLALPLLLSTPLGNESFVGSAVTTTLLLVFGFAPLPFLLWLWTRFYERRPFWTMGLEGAGALWRCGRGLALGLLMFAAVVAEAAALGGVMPERNPTQAIGLAALGGVLLVALGWAVQGPAEELLCRGWLLPVLGARYRLWLAVLLSSLLFAVLHSINPGIQPLAIFNLVLFGLFAALYALWEGGIWGVAALHAGWNWAQGNLFGLTVSGGNMASATLIDLQTSGPTLITGGAFGLEGGLPATLVLLLGIGVLAALLWRSR